MDGFHFSSSLFDQQAVGAYLPEITVWEIPSFYAISSIRRNSCSKLSEGWPLSSWFTIHWPQYLKFWPCLIWASTTGTENTYTLNKVNAARARLNVYSLNRVWKNTMPTISLHSACNLISDTSLSAPNFNHVVNESCQTHVFYEWFITLNYIKEA